MIAARLERSSFCEEERRAKKREWKADKAAQKLLIVRYLKEKFLNDNVNSHYQNKPSECRFQFFAINFL